MHMLTTIARRGRAATLPALGAALGLALLLSACGGGGSATATTTPATTVAATVATASPTAAATAAPATAAAGSGSVADVAFCADWVRVAAEAATATSGLTGSGTTDLKTTIEQATTYMQSLADHAPAEIKADFAVYAQAWNEFASVMQQANYDVTKLATDPTAQAALQSLSDPRLQQATNNITAWVTAHCGG